MKADLIADASARPEFKNLRCPYTGDPYTVAMRITRNGAPVFYAVGAYHPGCPRDSFDQAKADALRRDGVAVIAGDPDFRCAYTGAVLVPYRTHDGKCAFRGGMDPGTPCRTAAGLAGMLSRRPGRPEPAAPEPPAVPDSVRPRKPSPKKPKKPDSGKALDRAVQAAEDVLKGKA